MPALIQPQARLPPWCAPPTPRLDIAAALGQSPHTIEQDELPGCPPAEVAMIANSPKSWDAAPLTGRLVLADGTGIAGHGLGAPGFAGGEVGFNTAMTGYQEILTDPSYAGQIITFTFPHIGNVGTNGEDTETSNLAMRSGVRGCVLRAEVSRPSNYRALDNLAAWLRRRGIVALAGV